MKARGRLGQAGTTETTGTLGQTGTTGTTGTRASSLSSSQPSQWSQQSQRSQPRAAIPPIILPHGGYRNLIVYKKSDIIYQMTFLFCKRFLPAHGDRTVDQMTQAARSCKQNIAEGSAASGTSKKTELKLTNVARATLDELLEDYRDYMKARGLATWQAGDERAITAKQLGRDKEEWSFWQPIFETQPDETCANLAITLIYQTRSLLDSLIKHLEEDFTQHGGISERMHAARTAARGEEWDKAIYSRLDSAADAAELERRVGEIVEQARRNAWAIKKRKGWA